MLTLIAQWFNIICTIALIVVFVKLIRLLFRALKKYLGANGGDRCRCAGFDRGKWSGRPDPDGEGRAAQAKTQTQVKP